MSATQGEHASQDLEQLHARYLSQLFNFLSCIHQSATARRLEESEFARKERSRSLQTEVLLNYS
jgi:hypothetical protein